MEGMMHIFKQPGEGNRHVWARLAAEWTGQQEDGAGQSKGRASPITVMEGREHPRSRATRGLGANCHFRPGFPRNASLPPNPATWPGLWFIDHLWKVRWG